MFVEQRSQFAACATLRGSDGQSARFEPLPYVHLNRCIIHGDKVVVYQRAEQGDLRLHLLSTCLTIGTQAKTDGAVLGQVGKVYALGKRVLPCLNTQRQRRLGDAADKQRAVDDFTGDAGVSPAVSLTQTALADFAKIRPIWTYIVRRNIRQNLLLHGNLHLIGHARHGGKNLAVFAENHQRGTPYPIRQNLSRLRHLPLGSSQTVEYLGTVFVEV